MHRNAIIEIWLLLSYFSTGCTATITRICEVAYYNFWCKDNDDEFLIYNTVIRRSTAKIFSTNMTVCICTIWLQKFVVEIIEQRLRKLNTMIVLFDLQLTKSPRQILTAGQRNRRILWLPPVPIHEGKWGGCINHTVFHSFINIPICYLLHLYFAKPTHYNIACCI